MKTCRVCKCKKELECFCKDKTEKDGLNSLCRDCAKEQARKYMSNPENKKKVLYRAAQYRLRPEYQEQRTRYNREHRIRDKRSHYDRKRHYKLMAYEINVILNMQDNKCAICLKDFINGKFNVDHDHANGEVRGFLCSKCNFGLGHFYDDIAIINNAIKYLEKHSCAK